MKLSGRIRPSREPMITVDGEAKAVMQGIASYEKSPETLALLTLHALANKDVETGKIRPAGEAFAAIRVRVKH